MAGFSFRAGKREQALPLLRDAATALPDVAEVQYHYATALATLGDGKPPCRFCARR